MVNIIISGIENFADIKKAFSTTINTIIFSDDDNENLNTLEKNLICPVVEYNIAQDFYDIKLFTEYDDTRSLQIITKNNRTSIEDAKRYRAKIEEMAELIEDENELWVFPEWEENQYYALNKKITFNGILYEVIKEHTSQREWTPDVARALFFQKSGFIEEWPYWAQPLGEYDTYIRGSKVSYLNSQTGNMAHWISDIDMNNNEPGVQSWTKVWESNSNWPDWIQPSEIDIGYAMNAQVSHKGKHWISDIDNNIWEPGVQNWTEQ